MKMRYNAAFIPADQDCWRALELIKNAITKSCGNMGNAAFTGLLRLPARVKAIGGNLPRCRIAGIPALGNGTRVGGLSKWGRRGALRSYGEVVEVTRPLSRVGAARRCRYGSGATRRSTPILDWI